LVLIYSKKIRQRNTKYGSQRKWMYNLITMTTKIFKEYCINYLLLAIWEHTKRLPKVKKRIIQINQARRHGRRKKNINGILNDLNSKA
jgi:hypothetical protein